VASPNHAGAPAPPPFQGAASTLFDRLERARSMVVVHRPWLPAAAGLAVVALVAVGWWLGRPSSALPIDDAIPRAVGPSMPSPSELGPSGRVELGAGSSTVSPPRPGTGSAVVPTGGAGPTEPIELVVHVAGAVVRPGIVRLSPGARVIDALDAAGGSASDADLDQVNLAAPLLDGYQVRVPRQGEAPLGGAVVVPPSASPPAMVGAGSSASPPVNINRATAAELESLPGIGPSLALAVVAWREEHGPFSRLDDLLDVPGIGPAKLGALADHATV
jgi:competence protein ComEA